MKPWIKIILVSCSILTLAACSSKHKMQSDTAIDDANSAYVGNDDAQTSGIGDESSMSDQATSGNQLAQRTYYFDFDSNAVHESDMPAIAANAHYLIAHPKARVLLEGHTDPRGSREYNIGLGERRAKAVASILTEKGVNRAQVRIISYGAEKLASEGHSDADYQKDRRVVLVYSQR